MAGEVSPLRAVQSALSESDGIRGITVKIDIGDHDMYVKTAWLREVTLERLPELAWSAEEELMARAEDELLGKGESHVEASPQLTFARTRVRMVKIDATITPGGQDRVGREAVESLEASRSDIVRMWMESELQLASDLLASGAVGPDHLIEWWLGRRGYPSGHCTKLSFVNDGGHLQPMPVSGPFDAIAKLLNVRLDEWTKTMLTNG